MQQTQILVANLHSDLNGRGIAVGNHADMDDIADGDAFQRDRRSVLEPGGIFKVGAKQELARKEPARGAGHEENDPDEHERGRQDQTSHSQLRPLNLFAAWHGTPFAEMSQLTP